MISERLAGLVERAIDRATKDGKLGPLKECPFAVVVERPRLPEHGDLAVGTALKLAGQAKMSPIKIAEILAEYIEKDEEAGKENIERLAVAPPGFINFHLATGWMEAALSNIHNKGAAFGSLNIGDGKRVLVEYVSANPTGDLHIGHGRGAVYGSCLSNLFSFVGFSVEQEFYVNDAGVQIVQLGYCAFALYQRLQGRDVPYPEDGYPEESLKHFMEPIVKEYGDKYLNLDKDEGAKTLGEITKMTIMESQRKLLSRLGVNFNTWFSETSLHTSDAVSSVLQEFEKREKSYESEGALWLKSKELGDERDRVLRKSTGVTTYLAADAAYHLDKYKRGYDQLVTIWGADHHGQVPGLKASVKALDLDADKLEIILTQIVNLNREGQMVRMSKRAGTVVTLEEVMEEVGVDATRYYLAESNPQNPINFDLELAKRTSRENPAFYIQYAHARCAAILRRATEEQVNQESEVTEKPVLSAEQLEQYKTDYRAKPESFRAAFDPGHEVFQYQKELVQKLDSFPDEVKEAALARLPGRMARYAYDVANALQKFYEVSRVITDDLSVTKARLGLILATKQVLANALKIIGVSAPERM
ncbi:MAG: arginine--tRNA ligase [Candidatus Melainabacteria bacterium]|nr:arginine--tRNA ligase [Candidatus Melainabacteria bacterium]